ncbi:MAG: hypothetical protein S4CHLAM45_10780 [Chlamydiales bacterium]|nr:hypothetical protein [Chlamydiales bacterium]MCH9619571.1 hypothetical protein [Chlamydiales bacterium]MCH9623177.1 hypothetical protein [Chlamydiales bacterium]
MSKEVGAISGKSGMGRLSAKKQVSMETVSEVKNVQSKELAEMSEQIDHAFTLMHEIRERLENAYSELSK